MTVQRCVDGCAAAGFSAAGLEYNRECFCGNTNTPASDAVDINECNSPCFGDASQFCGGGNRILVYSKTYYPPPPPPPSNPNPAPNPPPSPTSSSSTPTPTFVTYRGRIQVTNTANNVPLGFLAKNLDSVGHYQYTASQNNAMIVTFQAPLGATSVTRQQLTTVNGASSFPLLGLVQGRDDINGNLATGSYQYVYFASTNPSAPGATPQNGGNSYTAATGTVRTYESSVWNINLVTGAASVQWINTDSSTPTTFLFTQSMVLYGGADPAAFFARYPAPVTNILLTFVPLP
ncbi:hypothetical protein FRC17_010573 [Serendipita sp. 399]|nr:hypothetical protein FRC17_010573 [Serendipita sp. 399]